MDSWADLIAGFMKGIKVPEELALIGYDNAPVRSHSSVCPASIRTPISLAAGLRRCS